MSFHSVFDEVWDVVIFGAGYAGFAAAWQCRRAGRRVLLADLHPALLRESSWSFAPHTGSPSTGSPTGSGEDALWCEWLAVLQARGALGSVDGAGPSGPLIDGALAEVLATRVCQAEAMPALYYAAPLAVHWRDGLLAGVTMASKGGLHALAARQWIDATERGELLQLLDPHWQPPAVLAREWHLHFRSARWAHPGAVSLQDAAPGNSRLTWEPTLWPNERALRIHQACAAADPGQGVAGDDIAGWLPALRALRTGGQIDLREAVLTHGSVVPWRTYASPASAPSLPPNLQAACASLAATEAATLCGRFRLGIHAARALESCSRAGAGVLPPPALPSAVREEIAADVVVAGLGTAGALAAVAAARESARVAAFDTLPFAGGISAGGGIHYYWFGVRGGLQQELDDRVRELMPLFGTAAQVRGFHPDAKKLVLACMLDEAGVHRRHGALLCAAARDGRRVLDLVTTAPGGPLRWRAGAWIDSTGDGDLCVSAGASFRWGRPGDGRVAAYSQSSGRAMVQEGKAFLEVVNFDAGFCDPASAEDLTRARRAGVLYYLQDRYDEIERPTYLAPAIGLRQSRHIETEYAVTLADLVERRTFADAVSYAGGHFDNRTRDFEFESDEALFWIWVCHQHGGRLACDVPYRSLLPLGLDNVWIACRALGMTTDAHYCVRMQRDMQRIGEVAGYASAIAAREACPGHAVPFPALRAALSRTGAIAVQAVEEDSFGPCDEFTAPETAADSGEMAGWLQDLAAAPSGSFLWHLYRDPHRAAEPLRALLHADSGLADSGLADSGLADSGLADSELADSELADSELADSELADSELAGWRAAAILAMWGESDAEPRLLRAIHRREEGDAARELTSPGQEALFVPRWLVAISLLRRCGTPACLGVLESLAARPDLVFNARTAIALTAAALFRRWSPAPAERTRWVALLDALLATPAPGAVRQIQSRLVTSAAAPVPGPAPGELAARANAVEDFGWQLHLAVGRARAALNLRPRTPSRALLEDPRRLVRASFAALLAESPHQERLQS